MIILHGLQEIRVFHRGVQRIIVTWTAWSSN